MVMSLLDWATEDAADTSDSATHSTVTEATWRGRSTTPAKSRQRDSGFHDCEACRGAQGKRISRRRWAGISVE